MKKTITIVVLLLFNHLAISQDGHLNGRVLSVNKGKPILDQAFVVINGTTIGAITDSLGYYEIKELVIGKSYDLKVSAYGYAEANEKVIIHEPNTSMDFNLDPNCTFNRETAKEDILRNNIRLLLFGSIVPTASTPVDRRFERNFGVEYLDFGCSPPAMECLKEYNQTIFKHLDQTYGSVWRKSVRQDVEFLK